VIKLSIEQQLSLREQPEYGMGYQYGAVYLSTGSTEIGYILNGASFATKDELTNLSPVELAKAEKAALVSRLTITYVSLIARSIESLKNVRRVRTAVANCSQKSANVVALSETIRSSQGAKDAPITTTAIGDIFKRFSAYADDFRITQKRGLKAGTFATTAADAVYVRTGGEAVSRYALENKQSANKRFTITPPGNTRLQEGIVQPAYGEVGGGVEVIFVDGTCDGTVSMPEIIPE
jgi:hypothetical protein